MTKVVIYINGERQGMFNISDENPVEMKFYLEDD